MDRRAGAPGRLRPPRQGARRASGVEAVEVRRPEQLDEVDGLVIPGRESTTLLKLMDDWLRAGRSRSSTAAGKPIFGTCAGLILLAREVENPAQFSLGSSTSAWSATPTAASASRSRRAARRRSTERCRSRWCSSARPRIRRVGRACRRWPAHRRRGGDGRQDRCSWPPFHPELTDDDTVHRLLLPHGARGQRGA